MVTGANRGVGLQVAGELARWGATVILGARDIAKGEQAVEQLAAPAERVRVCACDVADDDSVRQAAA